MPKKRKTRKDKERSATRILLPEQPAPTSANPQAPQSHTYQFQAHTSSPTTTTKKVTSNQYAFLIPDLRKTAIVTAVIIIVQLVLTMVIK